MPGSGSDLLVVGPSGRRSRLPAFTGRTYPGHGIIVPRLALDHALREAALEAGALGVRARITGVERSADGRVDAVISSDGQRLAGDVIIAADGALSPVARLAGMLDPQAALWGFAIRAYVPAEVPLPLLVLLDASPWHIYPGYGWLFPGEDGRANVGIGVGLGSERGPAPLRDDLARLVALLSQRGDLSRDARPGPVMGGWLRMGGTGAPAAAGNVLLGRRRGRVDQPAAGRGHRPGHDQREAGRRGGAGRPGPGGRGLRRGDRGGVRAVHGRRVSPADRDAGQAGGRVGGHAAAHRAGHPAGCGGHLVDLLERPGRRRAVPPFRLGRARHAGPARRGPPGPNGPWSTRPGGIRVIPSSPASHPSAAGASPAAPRYSYKLREACVYRTRPKCRSLPMPATTSCAALAASRYASLATAAVR